ncbi:hypothetical protein TSOC_004484 [Tetrabaena socialis]|uniref:Uncharacterized protein n=1 Tax=Tetrabaena socialis TaxID=47790 RepID=A0A2J8A8W0_9CHLO|nr:hypothetical protein TSOC_004484 [Tetrabaena socialis]|eukprot:PNH08935.1 hypothetical protein TSOC_004484 [Tetrabaena socialis]
MCPNNRFGTRAPSAPKNPRSSCITQWPLKSLSLIRCNGFAAPRQHRPIQPGHLNRQTLPTHREQNA